jgi:hypothetical protein
MRSPMCSGSPLLDTQSELEPLPEGQKDSADVLQSLRSMNDRSRGRSSTLQSDGRLSCQSSRQDMRRARDRPCFCPALPVWGANGTDPLDGEPWHLTKPGDPTLSVLSRSDSLCLIRLEASRTPVAVSEYSAGGRACLRRFVRYV